MPIRRDSSQHLAQAAEPRTVAARPKAAALKPHGVWHHQWLTETAVVAAARALAAAPHSQPLHSKLARQLAGASSATQLQSAAGPAGRTLASA